MKRLHFLVILISAFSFLCANCEKEDEENNNNNNNDSTANVFNFKELTAEKDTISATETIKINAVAEGNDLTYSWTTTQGDIVGSGNEVDYAPSPCTLGEVKIECTVANDDNSETKEITIYVG